MDAYVKSVGKHVKGIPEENMMTFRRQVFDNDMI
jgi:hypothetical protein